MKKLVASMLVVAMASFTVVNAAATFRTPTDATLINTTNQDKVEVKPEELPEPVKATLGADPYTDWKITKAYSVSSSDGKQYYEISLSKGEETATVNLDKDGKKVE